MLLSRSDRGETGDDLWRASKKLHDVALRAISMNPDERFETVARLAAAWRDASTAASAQST